MRKNLCQSENAAQAANADQMAYLFWQIHEAQFAAGAARSAKPFDHQCQTGAIGEGNFREIHGDGAGTIEPGRGAHQKIGNGLKSQPPADVEAAIAAIDVVGLAHLPASVFVGSGAAAAAVGPAITAR